MSECSTYVADRDRHPAIDSYTHFLEEGDRCYCIKVLCLLVSADWGKRGAPVLCITIHSQFQSCFLNSKISWFGDLEEILKSGKNHCNLLSKCPWHPLIPQIQCEGQEISCYGEMWRILIMGCRQWTRQQSNLVTSVHECLGNKLVQGCGNRIIYR
jgi:hypothetical protein